MLVLHVEQTPKSMYRYKYVYTITKTIPIEGLEFREHAQDERTWTTRRKTAEPSVQIHASTRSHYHDANVKSVGIRRSDSFDFALGNRNQTTFGSKVSGMVTVDN